jgi:hypothetical protein
MITEIDSSFLLVKSEFTELEYSYWSSLSFVQRLNMRNEVMGFKHKSLDPLALNVQVDFMEGVRLTSGMWGSSEKLFPVITGFTGEAL